MKQEYTFLSTDGKTQIHAIKWTPDSGNIKAVLQLVHGMIEFIDRYDDFARFMADHDYLVVGHDHLGHGGSVATTDDWGYIGDKPSQLLTEDMHKHRIMTQKEYPDKPYFILGHSMGSYMLRKYLADYGEGLSGAIIMGTGYVPTRLAGLALNITRTMGRLRGWRHKSSIIEGLAFGKPYEAFNCDGTEPENSWLTKDVDIVKAYYANPANTFRFTMNGYLALFEAVYFDSKAESAEALAKNLPLLIVSGSDDPVGDLSVGVTKAYEMYKKAGMTDVTLKLYEGDRHEILNETDRDVVYEDLLRWMNSRVNR